MAEQLSGTSLSDCSEILCSMPARPQVLSGNSKTQFWQRYGVSGGYYGMVGLACPPLHQHESRDDRRICNKGRDPFEHGESGRECHLGFAVPELFL